MKVLVVLTGLLMTAGCPAAVSHAAEMPEPAEVQAQFPLPWDQPPPEFREVERKGFHAGVQAAANDYEHHRSPEPERRKEYRRPHVSRSFQDDYRKGFVRGYNDAYKHLMKSNGRHS